MANSMTYLIGLVCATNLLPSEQNEMNELREKSKVDTKKTYVFQLKQYTISSK